MLTKLSPLKDVSNEPVRCSLTPLTFTSLEYCEKFKCGLMNFINCANTGMAEYSWSVSKELSNVFFCFQVDFIISMLDRPQSEWTCLDVRDFGRFACSWLSERFGTSIVKTLSLVTAKEGSYQNLEATWLWIYSLEQLPLLWMHSQYLQHLQFLWKCWSCSYDYLSSVSSSYSL